MNINIPFRLNSLPRSAVSLLCLALALGAQGQTAVTWDANNGAGPNDGSGTWVTGGNGWWNGSANVDWAASDIATFGAGTDGIYAITVGGAIICGNPLTFNNSGYTLGAASATAITFGGTISVAANKSATIGTNVTLTRSGGFSVSGGGILNISGSGATFKNTSGNSSTIGNGTTVNVLSGGTCQNTGSSASSLIIGDTVGGTLNVNGGAVTVQGNFILNNSGSGFGSVTLTNGGSISLTTVGNAVRFGGTGGSGTLNLDGGTLTTPRIYQNNVAVSATNNFNGGTLQALNGTTSAANFMTGLTCANVRNGGAIINPNGQNITIGQPLLHSVISGDNATDGGLTIVGTGGSVALTGTNTYTGPTTINGSVLIINAPYNAITAPVVNNGGLLEVAVNTNSSYFPAITLNNGGGLEFNLGAYSSSNVPGITTANLIVSGTNVIDISGGSIPVTSITLLTYTNKTGTSTFVLGTLPPGVAGTVTDTGSALVLNVTSPSGNSYVWSAGSGNWDFVTANWNSGTAIYSELSPAMVTFPDNAVGTVNITTNVNPYSIAVTANTGSYTFSGAGSIGGATSFSKSGANLLTLSTSNSYPGATTISAGAIVVTANSALGNTAGGGTTVNDGSALALSGDVNYSAAEPLTISGPGLAGNGFYSGSGTQRGALQSISGNNTWAGNITFTPIDSNTRIGVQDGSQLTLSGNITQSTNGLSLIFRAGNTAGSDITISGNNNNWNGSTSIYGGGGAALHLGADNALPSASRLVVSIGGIGGECVFDLNGFNQEAAGLSGDVTGVITDNGGQPSTLTLNPTNNDQIYPGVIQDGANSVSIIKNGAYAEIFSGIDTYTGNTIVNDGTLRILGSLGATSIVVNNGAYLDGTGTISGPVTINAGGILTAGGGSIGTLNINNNLTIVGNLSLKVNKSLVQSNDFINVSGILTNAGVGTLSIYNTGTNALAAGDSFYLFSQAVGNGNSLTISGPAGVIFTNKLQVDGSIAVVAITATYPTNLSFSVIGNTMTLTWPSTHLGWYAQSNSVNLADTNYWFDVPNSQNGTNLIISIDPATTNVFYRLRMP